MKALIATLILAAGLAFAQFPPEATDAAFRQVVVSDVAKSLGDLGAVPPPQAPAYGRLVMLSVHDGSVRVRFDGVDPDADTGHLIAKGSFMLWPMGTARKARFIRAGDDDAAIAITEAVQ